jgi:hypothetical protein
VRDEVNHGVSGAKDLLFAQSIRNLLRRFEQFRHPRIHCLAFVRNAGTG